MKDSNSLALMNIIYCSYKFPVVNVYYAPAVASGNIRNTYVYVHSTSPLPWYQCLLDLGISLILNLAFGQ
jgi:hypothetical protein